MKMKLLLPLSFLIAIHAPGQESEEQIPLQNPKQWACSTEVFDAQGDLSKKMERRLEITEKQRASQNSFISETVVITEGVAYSVMHFSEHQLDAIAFFDHREKKKFPPRAISYAQAKKIGMQVEAQSGEEIRIHCDLH